MDSSAVSDTDKAIFSQICQIVQFGDFSTAQMSFYEKNCGVFTNDEENKLEYKTIYEEYVYLMEQSIDTEIKASGKFDEDEIKEFYTNLAKNVAFFEEENTEVMDLLFGMIDFMKFKAQMLTLKSSINKESSGVNEAAVPAEEQVEYQTYMTYDKFMTIYNEDLTDKALKWKQKLNQKKPKNGVQIKMYQRPQKDMAIDLIRLEATMEGVSIDAVVDQFINPPVEKSKMYKEHKVLEQISETESIVYDRFAMPLMSDRDCITKMSIKKMDNGSTFIMVCTLPDRDDCPPVKNVIRVDMFITLILKPDESDPNKIQYCELSSYNFRGSFPARLFNMMLSSMAQEEFQNIVKAIKAKN